MTRFTKILTAAFAAVLVFGFTALADGWTQDSRGWLYYEGGSPVYYQWKQDSNGDFFYLGGDGYMVVSQFVEDRYVDSTGRLVKRDWRQIDGNWYYFDDSGHMISGTKRQINGQTYYFDYDGVMMTGWLSDGSDWYYCDMSAGGHLVTNDWRKLAPAEDMYIEDEFGTGSYWFYFQQNGKVARSTSAEYKEISIRGCRYAFDSCGRMQTGWVRLEDKYPAITGYKFYNDSNSLGIYGAAHTGWLSAFAPEEIEDTGEVGWYYFDQKGVPAAGEKTDDALNMKMKKITKNGTTYSYLFDENGHPVYGLQKVMADGEETSMYFGTQAQSCLQKSNSAVTVTEGDGSTWKYYFTSQGYGFTGIKNNCLYYKGKLQKAVDDTRAYYTVNGVTYLVNASGTLQKNYNKNKASDEVEYKSDAYGVRDGGTAAESQLLEPEYWSNDY